MTSRRSRFCGFTLVELLVVVAIIGIMMALLLPSFRGFGRSSNMRSAVSQIRTTMSLARQNAITKRQTTFVVFAGSATASAAPSEAWRTYRSFAVWVTLNSNPLNPSGVYLKAWTTLPPGAVFVADVTAWPGSGNNDSVLSSVGYDKDIPFPVATSNLVSVKALQFNSDGSVVGGGREVYLTEGITDTSGNLVVKPNAMRFGVEAFQLTGQIRVRDYSL